MITSEETSKEKTLEYSIAFACMTWKTYKVANKSKLVLSIVLRRLLV
jgi:hypothetical protein